MVITSFFSYASSVDLNKGLIFIANRGICIVLSKSVALYKGKNHTLVLANSTRLNQVYISLDNILLIRVLARLLATKHSPIRSFYIQFVVPNAMCNLFFNKVD